MKLAITSVAAAMLAAVPAHASVDLVGEIYFTGTMKAIGATDIWDATGLEFTDGFSGTGPGRIISATSPTPKGGFFQVNCMGSCGSVGNLPSFSVSYPDYTFLNFNYWLAFRLESITSVTRDDNEDSGSLKLVAKGSLWSPVDFEYPRQYQPAVLTIVATGSGNVFYSGWVKAVTPTVPSGVPEPASWAMMIAGMGLLGGALRASRRSTPRIR